MLSPSRCHSCVWLQASPHIFTNISAGTEELALSLSRHAHLSLWFNHDFWTTHHSALVTMEVLYDLLRLFVPQEDVAAVRPSDDVLTVRPIKVHTFH